MCERAVYAKGLCKPHYARKLYDAQHRRELPPWSDVVEHENFATLQIRDQGRYVYAVVLIDLDVAEQVACHLWRCNDGVVCGRTPRSNVVLKKELLPPSKALKTIVLNGDELDLRRQNLAIVSQSELMLLCNIRHEMKLRYIICPSSDGHCAKLACGEAEEMCGVYETELAARAAAYARATTHLSQALSGIRQHH